MQILADENIPLAEEFFSTLGQLRRLPGRSLDAAALQGADVLLVRSVTRVDKNLLQGSKVRFVGTCTIGTDHLDLSWLKQQGIAFASAPGCNAQAVVDYVLGCLLVLAERSGTPLKQRRYGVVGCGAVGGRLAGQGRRQKAAILSACKRCSPNATLSACIRRLMPAPDI